MSSPDFSILPLDNTLETSVFLADFCPSLVCS
jgi:hypothetical protein